jgi:hypothetical protein
MRISRFVHTPLNVIDANIDAISVHAKEFVGSFARTLSPGIYTKKMWKKQNSTRHLLFTVGQVRTMRPSRTRDEAIEED